MPQRPSARQTAKPETATYQAGVPIEAGGSALLPGDRYDQDETAQDHPAPVREMNTSTEVTLPDDLLVDEATSVAAPEPAPAPASAVAPAAKSATNRLARSPRVGATSVRGKAASARQPVVSKNARTRSAATSTGTPRVSSRRMSFDKAGIQKAVLWVGVGLLVAVVAITAVVLLATRGSEDRRLATEALGEAERQQDLAKSAIANRRGSEARKAYDAAIAALTGTAQLGGAVAAPPEIKPVVKDLALRAFELRAAVETLRERIGVVQAENAAASNLSALTARFATLGEASTDLDQLEKDVLAYVENPVDPQAGPSATSAATHARFAADARLRLASIATERERRKVARSSGPLRLAESETDGLIQQERFGDALAKLDTLASENPEADFAALRAQVEDAADKVWRSAKSQVETRLADWKSPGAAEGQRKLALIAAKERLNQVITRFGMPTYVDQARNMLMPLP